MLNRRTLRIKIMQSLFAFEQCIEADYQLAKQKIEERFQPDLNSMEVQDKELLRKQKKIALDLFEKRFKRTENESEIEKVIVQEVNNSIVYYHDLVKKDQSFLGKNIIAEIEKLSHIYYSMLELIVAFSEESKSDKKNTHTNFIEHPWIKALHSNESFNHELIKSSITWKNSRVQVREWFRDRLKDDATYIKFRDEQHPDVESQKTFIKYLIRKVILGPGVAEYYEEMDIRWAEDKEIIKSLLDKTMKSFSNGQIEIQKMSLDWEDDKQFIKTLFKSTIDLKDEYKELISNNTKNWEVDRLPLTDRVILEMALAEMLHFPNIPVKVTINEYIELAKGYSTPKSRQFINGILDVISKLMKESGSIKKSGRGLLDNK